jgi:hypothetical protein
MILVSLRRPPWVKHADPRSVQPRPFCPDKSTIQEPGYLGAEKEPLENPSGSDPRRELSMPGERDTFHPLLPVWSKIPEHGSDQQERGYVANQVTRLVSVKRGLQRHDAGVHDA